MDVLLRQYEEVFRNDGLGDPADRLLILETFLKTEGHVTAHELTDALRQEDRAYDEARVREALRLFCRYGVAFELRLKGRDTLFEHRHLGEHHDHFVCVQCGDLLEFADPDIEEHQRLLAGRHGFRSLTHRLEIYGLCPKCAMPPEELFPLSMATVGERVRIIEIRGGKGKTHRLVSMGIHRGEEALVMNSGSPGPFIVAVGDTRIALGRGMAHAVMVTSVDAGVEGMEKDDEKDEE